MLSQSSRFLLSKVSTCDFKTRLAERDTVTWTEILEVSCVDAVWLIYFSLPLSFICYCFTVPEFSGHGVHAATSFVKGLEQKLTQFVIAAGDLNVQVARLFK